MEPKELERIWACASGSDLGRRSGPLGTEPEVFLAPLTSRPCGHRRARSSLADPPAMGRAAEKDFMEAILSLSFK